MMNYFRFGSTIRYFCHDFQQRLMSQMDKRFTSFQIYQVNTNIITKQKDTFITQLTIKLPNQLILASTISSPNKPCGSKIAIVTKLQEQSTTTRRPFTHPQWQATSKYGHNPKMALSTTKAVLSKWPPCLTHKISQCKYSFLTYRQ